MKRTKHLGSYLFLGLASIIFAFPFYFLLVSATNTSLDVTNGRLLPGNALWQNLTNLFSQTQMRGALINSAIVALWQTILALLVGSVAGYGFEVYRSRAKDIVFNILLISNLGSSYSPDFGLMMTAISIATLPTIAIFFILQRHFVAGMLGSVK